jgi:hypothetical protein
MKTVYLDIETIPGEERPSRDSIKPPGNMKKPETIRKWFAENADSELDKIHHKQGLDSMAGRILCTGMAIDDEDPVVFDSLIGLDQAIMGINEEVLFVGHNILKFDAKWLVRHGIMVGLDFPTRFNFNRYKGNILDTMSIWSCGDYQDIVSLDNIAKFLGLEGKTSGMDGSKVWEYFKAGRMDEIMDYCADDIRVTRRVFKAIRSHIRS